MRIPIPTHCISEDYMLVSCFWIRGLIPGYSHMSLIPNFAHTLVLDLVLSQVKR